MKTGVLSSIKSKLVADERRVRLVLFGLFNGLQFEINLRSQTQLYLGLWERETYSAIRHAAQSADWFVNLNYNGVDLRGGGSLENSLAQRRMPTILRLTKLMSAAKSAG